MSNSFARATLLALIGLTASASALAQCNCSPLPSAPQAQERAGKVFRGTVVLAETPDESFLPRRFGLVVSEVWKGDVLQLTTTLSANDQCSRRLEVGLEYLVYTEQDGSINRCDRTRLIGDADDDLEFLGKGEVPVSTSTEVAFRNAAVSGTWFEPDRPGQGLQIQVLEDGQAAVSWYGQRAQDRNTQLWLFGVGQFVNNVLTIDQVFQPTGGGFGNFFSPMDLALINWGRMELTFSDETLRLSWVSSIEEFGTGELFMSRLTRAPAGFMVPDLTMGAPTE